jgi:hypothetical protein
MSKTTTTIYGCVRCGEDHEGIEPKRFKNPCGEWTHWTMCPVTNEPILIYNVPEKVRSDGNDNSE